jgi:hypothetical protein
VSFSIKDEVIDSQKSELTAKSVSNLRLFDATYLVILSNCEFHVYIREKMITRQKKSSNSKSRKAALNADGVENPKIENSGITYSEFARLRVVDFSAFLPASLPPTCFVKFGTDTLVFGFTNGLIKIILCDFLSDDDEARNPRAVCSFTASSSMDKSTNANEDNTKSNKRSSASIIDPSTSIEVKDIVPLPWQSIYGDPYVIEFLTLGGDNSLAHWGIRTNTTNPVSRADVIASESNENAEVEIGDNSLPTEAKAYMGSDNIASADRLGVRYPYTHTHTHTLSLSNNNKKKNH